MLIFCKFYFNSFLFVYIVKLPDTYTLHNHLGNFFSIDKNNKNLNNVYCFGK